LQNKCSVAELNFRIWSNYQNKITAWPVGGAPPNWESLPFELHKTCDPKKVMIFSPHPDDDVICMGATMEKLNKQGHEVFVAYQTSGAFAVMYDNVVKTLNLLLNFRNYWDLKIQKDYRIILSKLLIICLVRSQVKETMRMYKQ